MGEPISKLDGPERIAIKLMLDRNRWLIRIRWIYSFFILLFFIIYSFFLNTVYITFFHFFLILILSLMGNVLFILFINRGKQQIPENIKTLSLLISLQLDFDLVILFLYIFFSGGFGSPVLVLFIFYVMVTTFVIEYRKAFKNTVISVVLIVLIFLKQEGLVILPQKLVNLIAFIVILIFSFFISAFLSKKLRENEKILQDLLKKSRELSITDGLTHLYNQTHFFEVLEHEVQQSRRYNNVFSVVILDIDDFKKFNDTNGHILGSQALERVGLIMKRIFRASDILARYGGDEFVAILPHTDRVGAFLAAERLREAVDNEPFGSPGKIKKGKITISLGINSFPEGGNSVEEILSNADKALYHAKNTGRNRVVIYAAELEQIE
jgi:diguanylate cyclase (GGDEF)-like protein